MSWWQAAALAVLAAAGCGGEPAAHAGSRAGREDGVLTVAAVNYPLAYMARRVGGAHVEVELLAPAGVDPAFWQPGAEQVARIQAADLILLNGAGYADWTRTASLPLSRVVDTSAGFRERLIEREGVVTHSHGPEGEHAHGATASTTWLDPELAALQAAAIRAALAQRAPEAAEDFRAGYESLAADLSALDLRLAAAVATDPGRAVIFSHPVYDYLARRYGMNGRSLHWEPDQTPTAEQWAELAELAEEHGSVWMIWEAPPLKATVAELERRGVQCAVFAPCGNRPEQGDLLDALNAGAAELERVYARY